MAVVYDICITEMENQRAMKQYIHYFFKLKFYLGLADACRVLWAKEIAKSSLRVKGVNHEFFIRYDDFADNQIFNEVILRKAYAGLLHEKRTVRRILDLGANIGLASITFLSEYPDAEIVAVEPEMENFSLLLKNVAPYNERKERARCLRAGVWNKDGKLLLVDSQTGSHGYRVTEYGQGEQLRKDEIEVYSIRSLLRNAGWEGKMIDIVKVDIEGSEKELFEADTEWLEYVRCLVVETHDRFKPGSSKAVFAALSEHDYRLVVRGSNLIFYLK